MISIKQLLGIYQLEYYELSVDAVFRESSVATRE